MRLLLLGQVHLQVVVRAEFCSCYCCSFQLPVLEGQPNVTALDIQMKNLRDAAVKSITEMASRMREEASDVKATIGDIEDWLDRIKQLAEEVRRNKTMHGCMVACISTLYNKGPRLPPLAEI